MGTSTGDLLREYVRSLRWQVPLAVGVMVFLWAIDAHGARDEGLLAAVLLGLGFVVVLGPLSWLRWTYFGRSDKPFWKFLGLAVLWAIVSLAGIVGLMAALGVD